ncbi:MULTISPECIES: dihydroxyacetone kinase subunit DhaL [unclassified Kitasatospora]|uniref:dihydroxyacetone kinase subunit DhaL n=1 Tax=unclassified Kitasatospora TaxID=2633591 RepID=UPI00070C2207|nr:MULTISPECIES: dihydroxyacetone kinase subunit DhaL [unclassified Kitasatospora]KQV20610.1 dihydroxyacetone kinase [Kitasatospora sp. Root107]KRB69060.1 dihydroxyacetone kinase [Kitasatospora sp. Root187]
MDTTLAHTWLRAVAAAVEQRQQELTELDAAIGDGDHGSNLHRGFTAVLPAIEGLGSAGEVLTKAGSTLISKVGGASGPLYGKAFRAMGSALTEGGDFGSALAAGLAAIEKLGGAAPGDKTIVDAWAPALAAFERTGSYADAAAAAEQGALDTVPLQARKGRASYLGPRSIGHQDPGATSTALILRALADSAPGPV